MTSSSGPSTPGIVFDEYRLDNGLHVILHPDRTLPIVAINVWYHVGSKNEKPGSTGFAHLFEHMMFQGSENIPVNGHFDHVQKAGGTLNGSTSFDRTNYFETLPAHQLELGLWLEADRMLSLAVTARNLETQRNVVMEERRSRFDNQPYGTLYEQLFAHAYKVQPYRWMTIGSMEDIRNASLEDVTAFHSLYYRPENASLCLAGDFDPAAARELVARYFDGIPSGTETIVRPNDVEPAADFEVRNYVYDNIPLPAVAIGTHISHVNSADFPALEVLSDVLSNGESSRLHHKLVYSLRAAQSVTTYAFGTELPGLFIFHAVCQQHRTPDEVESVFWEELASIRSDGITERELRRAKNQLEASFVREITGLQSRADLLNSYHVIAGDTSRINEELERIEAVTLDDVQQAVNVYFHRSNSAVLHFLPRRTSFDAT